MYICLSIYYLISFVKLIFYQASFSDESTVNIFNDCLDIRKLTLSLVPSVGLTQIKLKVMNNISQILSNSNHRYLVNN